MGNKKDLIRITFDKETKDVVVSGSIKTDEEAAVFVTAIGHTLVVESALLRGLMLYFDKFSRNYKIVSTSNDSDTVS